MLEAWHVFFSPTCDNRQLPVCLYLIFAKGLKLCVILNVSSFYVLWIEYSMLYIVLKVNVYYYYYYIYCCQTISLFIELKWSWFVLLTRFLNKNVCFTSWHQNYMYERISWPWSIEMLECFLLFIEEQLCTAFHSDSNVKCKCKCKVTQNISGRS